MSTSTKAASVSGSKFKLGPLHHVREKLGLESRFQRSRVPFLTLWPNGQASLSYKYRTEDSPLDVREEFSVFRRKLESQPEGRQPPNLVSAPKSSQPGSEGGGRQSAKYGLKGITRYGSKMVRSAAYLLQREYGAKELCFLTLTVPPLGVDARARVARKWGEVMRQVLQYLSRRLERSGWPAAIVSVTEVQTKRFQRTGEAYLHAHLVLPARQRGSKSWVVDVVSFREWYGRLIERIADVSLGCLPRVETKTVRKSAEGYLGKYMTKGRDSLKSVVDDLGEDCVPGQQWNMTAYMRNKVKSATLKSWDYGEYLQMFLDMMVKGAIEMKGWYQRVEIDLGGRKITVCWVATIPEGFREELGLPTLDKSGKISINRD